LAVYRRSSRTRYILATLVLAAITLITIDSRSHSGVITSVRARVQDVFSPLQHATHSALQPIGNFLNGAIHYGSLRHENDVLRQQLAQAQQQQISSAYEKSQYEQLINQLNLPFVAQIHTVAVQVIDQGSSNFETTVTVNKGTSSGLALGQPVVAAAGLVGNVSQVSARTATITLLSDPNFAVGVRLDANNVGSAAGIGRGQPLRVTIDSTNQAPPTLHKGQVLLTSGLQTEKFPPGIPVAKVAQVLTPAGSVEPEITLTPLANLQSLNYLQVLLWSHQSP
jgi:rod shape-determining protein MreC